MSIDPKGYFFRRGSLHHLPAWLSATHRRNLPHSPAVHGRQRLAQSMLHSVRCSTALCLRLPFVAHVVLSDPGNFRQSAKVESMITMAIFTLTIFM